MSFSSTPLGQGRRLDHHTFLNKPNPNKSRPPNSPPRRVIPTSYSYGAPTSSTRSPPKSSHSTLPGENPDDSDQPALVRFARLKQREQKQEPQQLPQSQQPRPSTTHEPRTVVSAPHPEKWSVKDTSVNIASAFHQAATSTDDMPPTNPNDSWTSGARKPALPRSTSVDYEKETQSIVSRRLAAPPSRTGAARVQKPMSKSASIRVVPDSEGEEDSSRAKSPLEQVVELSKRLPPVAYFMRQRSQEPEAEVSINGNGSHEQSSYDYSAEEREYQAAVQKPVSRKVNGNHKRNRISVDNKAYRPTMSDLEESDEDLEDDDGKRVRRKKRKSAGIGGPPLTTLPVAGYDKKRRKKKGAGRTNGAAEEGDEDESSDEEEHVSEQRSQHSTTPLPRPLPSGRASVPPRTSMQPPSRHTSVVPLGDSSNLDTDIEQALETLDEGNDRLEALHSTDVTRPPFSIGAVLGRSVHVVFRLASSLMQLLLGVLSILAQLCGRVLGITMDVLIYKPIQFASNLDRAPFVQMTKYAIVGLTIYAACSLPLLPSSRQPYHAPDVPASNIGELSDRLQRLETALATLSLDTQRSRTMIEGDMRAQSELAGRLGALESHVQKETIHAVDAEAKSRLTTNEGLKAVKLEVQALHAQIQAQREADSRVSAGPSNDEEARAKLRALEERVGTVESGVKEALDLGKSTIKVGGASGAAWWQKLASGNAAGSAVTIKSADGQDMTSLIGHLVDSAVSRLSKDALARPDHALHSAGARIVPSLTSDTMEITPSGWAGQMLGLITGGNGFAIGRPPVTALHHELHAGHCWPFPGSHGQLAVALAAPVYISDITIDHVAKEVATDMRSAPRQMEVWGLVEGKENIARMHGWRDQRKVRRDEARAQAELSGQPYVEEPEEVYPSTLPKSPKYMRIANFTYNIYSPNNIQTFAVPEDVRESGIDFGVVVLLINSNWGRDDFTCLYRMRVHGEIMGGIPPPLPAEDSEVA
ncbi:hypothetical protein BKA93DRAFT_819979 [Sparassis latifolia]